MPPESYRHFLAAPILALSIGLGGCSHGLRYAPAVQFVAANGGVTALPPKLAALWPQFVRQQTATSCSVASVTTVLNTVLNQRYKPPLSQQAVVATDSTGSWMRATHDDEASGVTLDTLGLLTMRAFYASGIKRVSVDVVHVNDESDNTFQSVVTVLERHEKFTDDYFIICNFLQSAFFGDGDPVGHMSVVGAYDGAREQVLILDVDCRPVQPYWVSLRRFVAGMQTPDDETGEPRGYLVIRLG